MKIIKKEENKGFKDTFNFHMLENINLYGKYEVPYIPKYDGPIPKKIISYIKTTAHPNEYFMHFYLYDYRFDGKNGVWYGCQKDSAKIKSLLEKLKKYCGVISTDFSIYVDLPLAAQIWNIYRDRVMCMWLRKHGLNVIFNLRWGDFRTYDLVFSGIEKHGIIAVGSHGLIKHPENRQIFMDGFKEMIKRIEPSHLIIYGPCTSEMEQICKKHSIQVTQFDSEQTEARKEKKL